MLNSFARRVALTGACMAAVFGAASLTGACGVRPTAAGGEVVIIPQATVTSTSSTPPPQPAPQPQPSDSAPAAQGKPGPTSAGTGQFDAKAVANAAMGVEPNTTLGAVVFDRETGTELLTMEPDRQFHSASLVKLLIAIDTLRRGASSSTRGEITRMLSLSDDSIASVLWVDGGGPELVTRTAQLIGLQGTEPPETYGRWGDVKLTARDMVRVYQFVMNNLTPEDHTLLLEALAKAPEYAADGFRQYFGIPDGLNPQWAIKQGWGSDDHTMVLHSTGLVGAKWRYIVVLLTEHPLGSGRATCAQSVTAAASVVGKQLGPV